jgi:hypothetical protein
LWNYFFCVWRPQDLDTELTISAVMVIHVKSRHGVNPHFDIHMPRSMKGWWKMWFYLRNNTSTPLPVFTGNCPITPPSRGYGVAKMDLNKL